MKSLLICLFILVSISGYSQTDLILYKNPKTGSDTYYDLKAGDTIHFYVTFNQTFNMTSKVLFKFNIDGSLFGLSEPVKESLGPDPDIAGSSVIYRIVIKLTQDNIDRLKTGTIHFTTGLSTQSGGTTITKSYPNTCIPFTITSKPLGITNEQKDIFTCKYFDIQGVEIKNPANGFYIYRTNTGEIGKIFIP